MQLRKLDTTQHNLTRALWESVFAEDTRAFLDYYYFIKTRENEIYVIEEEGGIRSMLQLNPYMVRAEGREFLCHYIIGVATEEAYRKRGYMRMLLCRSMQDMYSRKEPFTYLMPAAEAIYTPYDFRFVYAQNQTEISGDYLAPELEVTEAGMGDAPEMAAFFNQYFKDTWQVYAVHSEQYYQTMILEQQSENGGVALMRNQGQIVGLFAYGSEGELEVREPLYLPEYREEFKRAVHKLKTKGQNTVKIYACASDLREEGCVKQEPIIMARILHLETFFQTLQVRADQELDCSFAVLDAFLPQNSRIWRLQCKNDQEKNRSVCVSETEDSEGVLPIAVLTSLLFGYQNISEIKSQEGVILSERLEKELGKIQPLKHIFLNEIV